MSDLRAALSSDDRDCSPGPLAGFSDGDIDRLADDFIAEDRGEETAAFIDWAHRVQRAAQSPRLPRGS